MIKFYTLIFFSVISLCSFSQTEQQQKAQKRSSRNTPSIQNNNTDNNTVFVPVYNNPPVVYPNYNYYSPYNPYYPYRGVNRRGVNRSGYYSDDYYNGVSSNGNPIDFKFRLGLTVSPNKPSSAGLFTTLGGQTFIYVSYEGSASSEYEHYNNISFEEASIIWEDNQIGEFEQYRSFSIGLGSEFLNNLNQYAGVNLSTTKKDLVFYDETLTLSDNGEYSINDTLKNDFSLMYGLIYDYNNFSFGCSLYFLSNSRLNFTLGMNI
jgi:hypothetical protein